MRVLDSIKNSLLEDREEALRHGEAGPTDAAIATCMGILERVSPVDLASLTWAAFGEDTGGVSLVARSLATNLRAEFCISPDGLNVSVVCIDEITTATSGPLDDVSRVDRIMQWISIKGVALPRPSR